MENQSTFRNGSKPYIKQLLSGIVLATLASCGGGADENTPTPVQTDKTAPTLTFNTASSTYWSQDVVILNASATDNSGNATLSISCTAGILANNQLVLPNTETALTITCTASATDAAGNSSSQAVNLMVNPVTVTLDTTGDLMAGQIAELKYQGPSIDASKLSLSAGNNEIIAGAEDSKIYFIVPVLPAGLHDIDIMINNRQFSKSINMMAGELIANPKEYLDTEITRLVQIWQTEMPDFAPDALQQLIDSKQRILELPENHLSLMAFMLSYNRNSYEQTDASGSMLLSELDQFISQNQTEDPECAVLWVALKDTIPRVGAIVGIALMATTSAPNAAISVPLFLLGTAVTVNAIERVERVREEILDQCLVRVANKIIGEQVSNEIQYNISTINNNLTTNLTFNSGKLQVFSVESDFNVANPQDVDSFNATLVDMFKLIESSIAVIRSTVQSILDKLSLNTEKSELEDAATLFISDFVGTNISYQISTKSEKEFTLIFEFVDETKIPVSGYQDFTFSVKNADESVDIPIQGRLYDNNTPDLVFVWDGKQLGKDTASLEAIMEIRPGQASKAENFLVINKGERAIQLDKANTSNSQFVLSGLDAPVLDTEQFTSVTVTYGLQPQNESLTTLVFGQQQLSDFDRSFSLKSVINYEADYLVQVTETPDKEQCEREPYSLTYSVSKVSYTDYQVSLDDKHIASFKAGSSSIVAGGSRTFEEDDGVTSESYSITIDYKGNVTGSTGWSWKRNDGNLECTGSSAIVGFIN